MHPRQNKTILIADDDKKFASLTKKVLTQFGYQVIFKTNKKSALLIANQGNIDLIIVDILMSGIDGLDFLMQYQHSKSSRHVPIIIWRSEHIEQAELNHLKLLAQQVVLKDEDVSKSLLREIETYFPLST